MSDRHACGQAQNEGIELGALDCKVEGGAGFIIGSTKDVLCTYTPADKALAPESYHGTINKIGLDIGVTGETRIAWVVFGTEQGSSMRPARLPETMSAQAPRLRPRSAPARTCWSAARRTPSRCSR